MDGIDIQAMIKEWLAYLPDWWDFVNDGTHGMIGIIIAVLVAMWAVAMLLQFSRGGNE